MKTIDELYRKYPSPCYILFEESLEANLQLLDLVQQSADVSIICALKGFAFWRMFPLVKQYLHGATASSLNEARLISEEMGCEAHTYAPVYTDQDFEQLLMYSSHLTFNSLTQYNRFHDRAAAFPKKVSLGLRINPEYSEIETDLYNPAVPGSRLGILREDMPDTLPEGIEGLHFHVLCENDSYALERCLKAAEEKFGDLIQQCKWFNMGGGHHISDGKITSYAITFETGKADLKPESVIEINRVVALMNEHPELSFEVQGHCDNTGTDAVNDPLSQQRAACKEPSP